LEKVGPGLTRRPVYSGSPSVGREYDVGVVTSGTGGGVQLGCGNGDGYVWIMEE